MIVWCSVRFSVDGLMAYGMFMVTMWCVYGMYVCSMQCICMYYMGSIWCGDTNAAFAPNRCIYILFLLKS